MMSGGEGFKGAAEKRWDEKCTIKQVGDLDSCSLDPFSIYEIVSLSIQN